MGWFNESWRHSLARKGIRTVYAAKKKAMDISQVGAGVKIKQPKTVSATPYGLGVVRAAAQIEEELAKQRKEKRAVAVVIRELQEGRLEALRGQEIKSLVGKVYDPRTGAWRAPETGEEANALAADDVVAVREAVASALVSRARLGEKVDSELLNQMVPQVRTQVIEIQKELRIRGAPEKFVRERGRALLERAEEKIGRTEAEIRREQLESAREEAQLRAMEEAEGAGVSLLPQKDFTAPFIDESYGGRFTNPLLAEPPAIGSTVGTQERLQAFDVFDQVSAGKKMPSFGDVVEKEVDALFNARMELGKVDKRSFAKGKKAYEKGDFEGLSAALAEAEEQRKQQEQRRNVVFQTRQLIDSPQNRQAQLRAEPGVATFMFSGGDKIAEQTRKVAKVHEAVQKGYSEAATREALLRQMAAELRQKPAVPEAVTPPLVDVVKTKKPSVWQEVGEDLLGAK